MELEFVGYVWGFVGYAKPRLERRDKFIVHLIKYEFVTNINERKVPGKRRESLKKPYLENIKHRMMIDRWLWEQIFIGGSGCDYKTSLLELDDKYIYICWVIISSKKIYIVSEQKKIVI